MPSVPLVSVVMPAYNAEEYVGVAIESILNQTLTDFEFLIIDDGSTDATGRIVADYAAKDPRIKVFRQEHGGVSEAANKIYAAARAEYIARIDADNMSLPTRLEKQLQFLRTHPEIGVVSTRVHQIFEDGRTQVWMPPTEPRVIYWWLMFDCSLMQGASMMRRALFDRVGPYRLAFGEDYDFWIRASAVTQLANLPEVLSLNRKPASSLTRRHEAALREMSIDFQRKLMSALLGRDVARRSVEILHVSWDKTATASPPEFDAASDLLREVYRAFTWQVRLTRAERAQVALNAIRRSMGLAQSAAGVSRLQAARILLESRGFLVPALSTRTIGKMVSMGTRLVARACLGRPLLP